MKNSDVEKFRKGLPGVYFNFRVGGPELYYAVGGKYSETCIKRDGKMFGLYAGGELVQELGATTAKAVREFKKIIREE